MTKLGLVPHPFNLSTVEMGREGSEVQGHLEAHKTHVSKETNNTVKWFPEKEGG